MRGYRRCTISQVLAPPPFLYSDDILLYRCTLFDDGAEGAEAKYYADGDLVGIYHDAALAASAGRTWAYLPRARLLATDGAMRR